MSEIRGNEIPTAVEWVNDLVYDPFLDAGVLNHFAACPTCHQWPLYGENPCPYCGQMLIVIYPEEARKEKTIAELVGVTANDDGGMVCEKCGSTEFEFTAHIDARDYFRNDFRCKKCGSKGYGLLRRNHEGDWIF